MCRKVICSVCFILLFALAGTSAGQDLDPNLVGWWKLDEGSGTTAADSSGNGNEGTLNGDPQWVTGILGSALEFDGVDDYVDIGLGAGGYFSTLNSGFTVAAWINRASTGTHDVIFGAGRNPVGTTAGDNNDGWKLSITSANVITFTTLGILDYTSSVGVPTGEWAHVAATFNEAGTELRIYLDGNFQQTISGNGPANPATGLFAVGFGATWALEFFDGALDDVRVYNKVLTEAEIKPLAFRPKARKPDPPDGAEGVTLALLSWTAGDSAAFHDVYLGTTPDLGPANLVAQNPKSVMVYYHQAGLEPGTTYYWRIDEVEADDVTIYEGDVWSFSVPPSTAYDPNPPDGAEFVNTEVELSWAAGLGANLHDIYFGTDETEVSDGTGDTFKGTWPLTTFSPGTLQKDTTYYWRIDEIETDGTTKHEGEVWTFKTLPDIPVADPNLLAWWKLDRGYGSTVLDWSGHGNDGTLVGDPQWADGYDGDALSFDGAGDSVNFGTGPSLTGTTDFTVAAWIKTSMTSNGVIIQQRNGGYNGEYRFMVTPSGTLNIMLYGDADYQYDFSTTRTVNDDKWHHAVAMRAGGSGYIYVDGVLAASDSGTLRNLDGTIQTAVGADIRDSVSYFNGVIDDVRVYTKALTTEEIKLAMRGDPLLAWDPSPVSRSTPDIDRAIPLSWKPGDKAAQHDVYLGTDETAVTEADASDTTGIYRVRQAATSYTPGEALVWGQTYYWRVDEYNADATISKGRIWSFTLADYLIVDDFEEYDDYCARIFYAWKDGWGHSADPDCGVEASAGNGTGSTVGNLSAPFAEQTIVHSGAQSMPFAYDNSGATGKARYSEAQREWAAPQDWTKGNVKALTLWFHGETGNAPETLYVAVEDSTGQVRVTTHPNPEALQRAAWQQWNIALTQFSGVNLASVKKMYLGVGNRSNPQAGGSGKLYIDDIRIYPPRCVPSLAKPAVDLSGNCIVDYADVEIVANQWLSDGLMITPVDPGTAGLVAHYPLNGNANDTVGGYNGTTSGIVSYGAGKIGQAIVLDGTDDEVSVPYSAALNPPERFTVSLWAKASSGGTGHRAAISCRDDAPQRGYIVYATPSNIWQFWTGTGSGWQAVAGPSVSLDEWVHLAAVFSSGTKQLYVDGILAGEATDTTLMVNDAQVLLIGAGANEGTPHNYFFQGAIDDARIYNNALSRAEVAWLAGYTSPFSEPFDLNVDGAVDFKDFAVLADAWLEEVLWP
jgi:hypothetical protein